LIYGIWFAASLTEQGFVSGRSIPRYLFIVPFFSHSSYKRSSMKILTRQEMEKLNTKRLLAYKNRLLKVRDATTCADSDCETEIKDLEATNALTKSSPIWIETYAAVKDILSTREHIEKK
jgi:hypothetical protein